jgi:hypothetical protein
MCLPTTVSVPAAVLNIVIRVTACVEMARKLYTETRVHVQYKFKMLGEDSDINFRMMQFQIEKKVLGGINLLRSFYTARTA